MSEPPISFGLAAVVCRVHGEPFRPRWPNGYATFVVRAFQIVVADAGFLAACCGDIGRAAHVLERRPMCSYLTPDQLLEIYRAGDFGVDARCVVCHEHKAGALYSQQLPGHPLRQAQVCFRCVAGQPCQYIQETP